MGVANGTRQLSRLALGHALCTMTHPVVILASTFVGLGRGPSRTLSAPLAICLIAIIFLVVSFCISFVVLILVIRLRV